MTTKVPKSKAGNMSHANSEEMEESAAPTAYDRLPAVISKFPELFRELEIEQR